MHFYYFYDRNIILIESIHLNMVLYSLYYSLFLHSMDLLMLSLFILFILLDLHILSSSLLTHNISPRYLNILSYIP